MKYLKLFESISDDVDDIVSNFDDIADDGHRVIFESNYNGTEFNMSYSDYIDKNAHYDTFVRFLHDGDKPGDKNFYVHIYMNIEYSNFLEIMDQIQSSISRLKDKEYHMGYIQTLSWGENNTESYTNSITIKFENKK